LSDGWRMMWTGDGSERGDVESASVNLGPHYNRVSVDIHKCGIGDKGREVS